MFEMPWTKLAKENAELKFSRDSACHSLRERIAQVNQLQEQLRHRDEMIAEQTKCLGSYASTIETLRSQLHGQETQTRKYRDDLNATSMQLDETIAKLERLRDHSTSLARAFAKYDHRQVASTASKATMQKKIQNDREVFNALLSVHESLEATLNYQPSAPTPQQ